MRIIGGSLKGRTIRAPDAQGTRPTSDRAREALFNILAHAEWAPDLSAARVIDAFAGSGSLGFEAISRGAAFCLFVETDAAARGCIRDNVETFQLLGNTRIHRRSATDLGAKPAGVGDPFNLVFLDPPYRHGLVPLAMVRRDTHDEAVPKEVFELLKEVLPLCKNVEYVIFERLGNTIKTQKDKLQLAKDFRQVKKIVLSQRKKEENLLEEITKTKIDHKVSLNPLEDENLRKHQQFIIETLLVNKDVAKTI